MSGLMHGTLSTGSFSKSTSPAIGVIPHG